MTIQRTPLDAWLAGRLGLASGLPPDGQTLADYQLEQLRRTVELARGQSPFYRDRLSGLPDGFPGEMEKFSDLPLLTAKDMRENHSAMLCVSRDRVARVVTLNTSGTTGRPKRLYFSDGDLELTMEFFRHGMSTMVGAGDRVLILLPGPTPDSVGDLLSRALSRMGAKGVVHGPLGDAGEAVHEADTLGAGCLVGIPVQILAMAEHPLGKGLAGRVKSVLLTTDYVPRALAKRVERAWGCEVFEHYGMTETGLGGGVDCRAHQGYHLRAADLYFEVVDPDSGQVLPPGQEGELVVSTLTREAMPLLRYLTGDLGTLIAGPCACGGVTPRLARVQGRIANRLDLGRGASLAMRELDEALFAVPGLMDYRAGLTENGPEKILNVRVQAFPGREELLGRKVQVALRQISSLADSLETGTLLPGGIEITNQPWPVDGSSKRTLGAIG
jgi:phenylacetate-CoA ligase